MFSTIVDWYATFGNKKGQDLGRRHVHDLFCRGLNNPQKMVFFLATFHTYGPFFELLIISHSFWARLELWTFTCFLVVVMPLVLKYVI
jgi:hypothetical protein